MKMFDEMRRRNVGMSPHRIFLARRKTLVQDRHPTIA
jgi:hypothetical protein